MKRLIWTVVAMATCLVAAAQPGGREVGQNVPGAGRRFIPDPDPVNVVLNRRAAMPFGAGATNFDGRSFNNAPTFFVYPDTKLDQAGADALVNELGLQPILENNFGSVVVINPVGAKYDASADFDCFVKMFNKSRSGNLKVIGFGEGATFVNQVIALKAADHVAGIVTVGGKPAKLPKGFASYGVPAFVAGKTAAKVAKEYEALNAACAPAEPLLQVVTSAATEPGAVFAEAWEKVLSRNFRYNNYKHTHYEGGQFGQYGPYELEPYTDWERLGIERIKVEQPMAFGPQGQQGPNVPKQLWTSIGRRNSRKAPPPRACLWSSCCTAMPIIRAPRRRRPVSSRWRARSVSSSWKWSGRGASPSRPWARTAWRPSSTSSSPSIRSWIRPASMRKACRPAP